MTSRPPAAPPVPDPVARFYAEGGRVSGRCPVDEGWIDTTASPPARGGRRGAPGSTQPAPEEEA